MAEHGEGADVAPMAGPDRRASNVSSSGENALGRRAFIAGSTGAAIGLAASSALTSTTASAASEFSALEVVQPVRLCDTRAAQGNFGYRRISGSTIRIDIAGRTVDGVTIPSDATAAVFTLVGINRTPDRNFLSAFPATTAWPGTASLNMVWLNEAVANLVTAKLSAEGAIDVYAFGASDVVLDLVGVYRPTGGTPVREGRYQLLPSPQRAIDTRNLGSKPRAGDTVEVDLTSLVNAGVIDRDALAVSANITAVGASDRGFVTAYPFGEGDPGTSSLNVSAGETRGIGSMVKLGTTNSGRVGFNVFVSGGAHLVIDIAGFTTGPSANRSTFGQFVAINPVRLLDTRSSDAALRGGDGSKKRLWPGWTRSFELPSSFANEAGAVAVNLAVTRTMGRGFFTLLGARTARGQVSNLNVTTAGQTVSNHAITQASTAGVECYSEAGADLICDAVGWFKGTPATVTHAVPTDPPPPPIAPPYWLVIPGDPNMNVGRSVLAGSADPIVNTGQLWHWTGTGMVAQGGAVATFGHRTDAGGPLRYLQHVGPGDVIEVNTSDHRRYFYEYAGREITSKFTNAILAATRRLTGESLAIIACTVGFDSSKSAYPDMWAPTSLEWRIVVNLRLIGWEDIIPTQ